MPLHRSLRQGSGPRHGGSRARFRGVLAAVPVLLLGLCTGACGGSGSEVTLTSGATPGSIVNHPDHLIGSNTFVVDANSGGKAGSLIIQQLTWGRLVNVRDKQGVLQNTDMVVGDEIRSDAVDFELSVNPFTEESTVRILHDAGTPAYVTAFKRLDMFLTVALDKGLDPGTLPPFTQVPRNAALMIKFNDLIDDATIQPANLRMVVGYPATSPFSFRLVQDRNHGDLIDADGDGVLEFHTSRLILDTTVSTVEADTTNPPLPINNLGLPPSVNQSQANVGVRIPTRPDASLAQPTILTNLAGNGLAFDGNGSRDASVGTRDIVRALRSGGGSVAAPDAYNGFLVDEIAPRIVGVQAVSVSTPTGTADDFVTTIDYAVDACALRPKVGDVIQQSPGVFAEVTGAQHGPAGGTVINVHFRVVAPPNGELRAGPAQIHTVWDPAANFSKQACFVKFSSVAPGAVSPGSNVSTDSAVALRFSEPMDPSRITAYENLPVLRADPTIDPPTARDFVIGSIVPAADMKQYSFQPSLEFKHTAGSRESYWVNLAGGPTGPIDLAGNPIQDTLPPVLFTLDPTDASVSTGGFVFRFSSPDELNNDGKPEWRGQTALDPTRGKIGPRPVTRFRATCDRTHPVPGQMLPFTQGLQTPLCALGSKLQTLWRYCDVGFGLQEESTVNVDVEHLYWAPAGGSVIADSYQKFEIRLSHTKFLPDESMDATAQQIYAGSGLVPVFSDNLLDAAQDPQQVVHPAARGYVVNPNDLKLSSTGAEKVMPYPLNQGLPVSQYRYYTWRDTAVLAKGAAGGGPGAELKIVCTISYGTNLGCAGCPYSTFTGPNPAPSLAMPLLMEFRCYPDSGAFGLNALDVSYTGNSWSYPNFRAFSTGGSGTTGDHTVDPDLETAAHGGFNPNSNPPGLPTLGADNTVYLGEMDLVTRISRMYSIWLDSQMLAPIYDPPIIEPRESEQPALTSIRFDYRGASFVTPIGSNIATDANFIDPYGDATLCANPIGVPCSTMVCSANGVPGFFQGVKTWRPSIAEINGARLFQIRVTFLSNTETNLSPSMSAVGFPLRSQ